MLSFCVQSLKPEVAVVLGTYNRLPLLQRSIASIRRSCGGLRRTIIVVDGGSTDDTLTFLSQQPDIETIAQGHLLGAVKAFNAGFARAVDLGAASVVVINDDDELIGPDCEIACCHAMLSVDERLGAVAFETDLRGMWGIEYWHGLPYCNKGVVRREAGMAAARAMGDPTGREWWGHDHHTYAADTEMGCWIWRLGWTIAPGLGFRVHDESDGAEVVVDPLRRRNLDEYKRTGTARLFHERWGSPDSMAYSRADAERFGGRLL